LFFGVTPNTFSGQRAVLLGGIEVTFIYSEERRTAISETLLPIKETALFHNTQAGMFIFTDKA
jgi:hypothetical protein